MNGTAVVVLRDEMTVGVTVSSAEWRVWTNASDGIDFGIFLGTCDEEAFAFSLR